MKLDEQSQFLFPRPAQQAKALLSPSVAGGFRAATLITAKVLKIGLN
jgi:hypothetical protein